MGLLSSALGAALSPVLNFMIVHLAYPFKVGGSVKALTDATTELVARSRDVQDKIKTAERDGRMPTHEVQRWLQKVDAMKQEAEAISEKYDKRCRVFGCCSPNCLSSYKISKNAAKNLLDVQKAYADGAFEDVAVKLPPPTVREMPTTSARLSAEDLNLQNALHYINDDNVGMIGIWGLGGVGKTHLLKKINNSFLGGSSFDVVIFVTASKQCSVTKIQAEIVKKLRLEKEDDVQSQASIISDFLSKRKFLMLLDDLWERLDLEAVGIPLPLGVSDQYVRKVVLTTRSADVFGQMEVRKEIKVACLNEDEAWCLFQGKVGHDTISSNPRIAALAKDVAKELKGLPLALIIIGRAMYAKKDPREWEDAINVLQSSRLDEIDPSGMEESVFHKLKLSYDRLKNDTLRQCFLTCSLWPEDQTIGKEELIECWMGLGLINEFDDTQSAYNQGYTLIGNLKAACLLDFAGPFFDEGVKMHDVIRDMALWISCDCGKNKNKWIVHAGVGQKFAKKRIHWNKAEYVSLMRNGLKALPSSNGPCSTELQTLLLQHNHLKGKALENIQTFTTLTYLDLSWNEFGVVPREVCTLASLEYLSLSHNKIKALPADLGHLIKLKFLYLQENNIHTIPKGTISKLEVLQVLDLSSLSGPDYLDYVPSLLEELNTLTNLKAVGIDVVRISTFERLSQFSNLPIRSLQLRNLVKPNSMSYMNMMGRTSFWLSGGFLCHTGIQRTLSNLTIMYGAIDQIIIGNYSEKTNSHLDVLNKLKFHFLKNLIDFSWNGVTPEAIFPKLTTLDIEGCDKLEHISWALYLPCLHILKVTFCENMKQIILSGENHNAIMVVGGHETRETSLRTFPCLRSLHLFTLPELVSICNRGVTFPSLEHLLVMYCGKLKKLPFQMHTMPSKLQKISAQKAYWWERLEWEEEEVKSTLQPLLDARPDWVPIS